VLVGEDLSRGGLPTASLAENLDVEDILFDVGGDPPVPPYPALVSSWGRTGAWLVLLALTVASVASR